MKITHKTVFFHIVFKNLEDERLFCRYIENAGFIVKRREKDIAVGTTGREEELYEFIQRFKEYISLKKVIEYDAS